VFDRVMLMLIGLWTRWVEFGCIIWWRQRWRVWWSRCHWGGRLGGRSESDWLDEDGVPVV